METPALPKGYTLSQNYPNPFNPSTRITYSIPEPSNIRVSVFNLLGQEITVLVDGEVEAGERAVLWDSANRDGRPAAGGVYFYRVYAQSLTSAKNFQSFGKMILMK